MSLIFWGFAAYVAVQVVRSFLDKGEEEGTVGGQPISVVKMQVGLLGSARKLKANLERIADRADTSSEDGLHYVLQETVLALLRNPDYCIYGAASSASARGLDGGEAKFNEISMEERGKIKEETLVNYGGRSRRSSGAGYNGGMSDLMVVTIIVAAEASVKLPKVRSRDELKEALNKLGALRSDQVMAVEVLWTPEDESDHYNKDDLYMDYPELNTL